MSEKVCNCNCAENRKEQFKELQPVLDQYAKVPGSLITILQKAQDIYGYLSIDTINYISEATGIKPAKIYGVATFYAQFRLCLLYTSRKVRSAHRRLGNRNEFWYNKLY